MKDRGIEVWIEGEHWPPEEWDPADGNSDVVVTFGSGERWGATFVTYRNVETLCAKNEQTGECLAGKCFWISDMILVDEVTRERIEQVIAYLIETDEFKNVFSRLRPAPERVLDGWEALGALPLHDGSLERVAFDPEESVLTLRVELGRSVGDGLGPESLSVMREIQFSRVRNLTFLSPDHLPLKHSEILRVNLTPLEGTETTYRVEFVLHDNSRRDVALFRLEACSVSVVLGDL